MSGLILFGGTFDPPHLGHIKIAEAVATHFQFERFLFLPCKSPLQKAPARATPEQRLDMLKLVLAPYPQFEIDLREMRRETPSYMADTLEDLRAELGSTYPITLMIGVDAFAGLPQWERWETLLQNSHILLVHRSGYTNTTLPEVLKKFQTHHQTHDPLALYQQPSGLIYIFNAGDYPLASTSIRQQLAAQQSCNQSLIPEVYEYILRHKIYADSN